MSSVIDRQRARRMRPRPAALGRAVAIGLAVLLAGACASQTDPASATESSARGSVLPSAGSSATATNTTASTTSTTASAPSTSSTSTTSTTSTTSSSTTSSTTTTVAPPVGGFACIPGTQHPTIWETRPPPDIPSPSLPDGWLTPVLGRSVQGREIQAFVRAAAEPARRVIVIGGIHGNEPVTPPSVRALLDAEIPDDVELWLVPVANPDGSAAGTRCNANGVDLNRNFSWGWRPADGGPAAFSEPETQTLSALVGAVEPDLVIWVHQPLGYVGAIGSTDPVLAAAWGLASGLPVRPDVTQHGGGESWTAFEAGVPSMLIEIDGWAATPEMVAAQRAAFEATLRALS